MYDPCVLTCPYFGPYIGILIAHKNSKKKDKKRKKRGGEKKILLCPFGL